jgi:TPR repeat protein
VVQAEACWRWAADLGDANAMNSHGILATTRDQSHQARQWHQRAAALGHPDAMYRLGYLAHTDGDDETARRRWITAAAAGHTKAAEALDAWLDYPGPSPGTDDHDRD